MLGVALVIGGITLVALAGAVALARFIAKSSTWGAGRGALLAAAYVLAVLVTAAVGSYTSIYYVKPVGLILAVAASAAVLIALFVTLGRGLRWEPLRVVALVGLAFVSMVFFGISVMGLSGLVEPPFPYTTRARQIAEANGFSVLMPRDQELQTDSLPIDPLPAPDKGVWLAYETFELEERKAGVGSAKGPLEARLREAITDTATEVSVKTATVGGTPAVVAEYRIPPPEGVSGSEFAPKFQRETKLIFERDGVEVRLRSSAGERERDGEFVPFPSLTTAELVAIAETLELPAQ